MIIEGDCLEGMAKLADNSVDLCLTDPPYGTTACKWDSVIPFEPMWEQLKRIVKPNGAICLFGSEPFSSHLRMSNIKMFRYDWIWLKSNGGGFLNANRQPLKRHEHISVFSQSQSIYFPQKTAGRPYRCTSAAAGETTQDQTVAGWVTVNKGDRFPVSWQNFKSETGLHPTQKPTALLEYLIKTYTREGETVLDFTMGSGSTGVACKNLNRQFIGIEKDAKYFEIAQKRIEAAML
jgi:DNA modification methylase